ncbi:hypothetical protein [Nostoc favosum]|uniref:Uncharacterized protein n=1 Tax=Nostoc favosum CHAB5714 TaxID=2780399 RepID=A0ABS8IFY6_9NOSO|nr:hypothetical protein [Nostoc favosum]MCC5603143.1 hypothetical protein [Nostoc favosum CHAB5714]
MYHSLKIKILDLDYIESTLEQDIMDVEAEKIVGGIRESGSLVAERVVKLHVVTHEADPLPDPPLCAWLLVEPINLLNQADCWLQIPDPSLTDFQGHLLATPVAPMILHKNTQM